MDRDVLDPDDLAAVERIERARRDRDLAGADSDAAVGRGDDVAVGDQRAAAELEQDVLERLADRALPEVRA